MTAPTTIAALATAPVPSALALVRLSGPRCAGLAREVFGRGRLPGDRRVAFGRYRELGGAVLDECLYVHSEGPRTYTGEATLEITCHGNPLIARRILDDLAARGVVPAAPGEFTRRAFLNGRMDLTQAEAVAGTIHARNAKALFHAQRQLSGALGRKVGAWVEALLGILARIEAHIDFPDEDLPPESPPAELAGELGALGAEFEAAARTARYTSVLEDGVRVVILGPPNAGKSSLLNALLGEARALVSPEPGTTRDYIREPLALGPHLLQLTDTAGLRPVPGGELERQGMARAHAQIATADYHLLVIDATEPPPRFEDGFLEKLPPARTHLILNKSDLSAHPDALAYLPLHPRLALSAKTGEGLAALRTQLLDALDRNGIVPDEEALIVNARHATALQAAATHLGNARGKIENAAPPELPANDLQHALAALGEITGRIDNEQMLDKLFATFCIGK
ncbi:MAG: tRNA uridine-5-carboxymethylaminomethyl(34) synthesis GTPase MnmE [Puniceicoccales bacterium]|jgi:tRNA modification GTPase|nr:tRNA uridine-5-carboxymethylaminomethyl(34) synthesis GTPase MnmE [Puniceicoccales bacterium]